MSNASARVIASLSKGRSKISNGTRLLANVDGRSAYARRFRDLVVASQLLQKMTGDIANLEKAMEQLKAKQDQIASDNEKAIEQLKTKQEDLARLLAKVSEQSALPKTSPPSGRTDPIAASQNAAAGATAAPAAPIAVAVPTAVAVLRRRMVIAVNVAIVEVCLHAAVRSSGPQASVRSRPHRVKSAVLSIGRSLPVFSDRQTISEPRRTSHQGQIRKWWQNGPALAIDNFPNWSLW
jgi:hypothetical protein